MTTKLRAWIWLFLGQVAWVCTIIFTLIRWDFPAALAFLAAIFLLAAAVEGAFNAGYEARP